MALLTSAEMGVEVTMRDRDRMRRCASLRSPEVVGLVQHAFAYAYAQAAGRNRRLCYNVDLGLVKLAGLREPVRTLNPGHYWVLELEKPATYRRGTWSLGNDSRVFLVADGQTGVLTNTACGKLHIRLDDLFFMDTGNSLCRCFEVEQDVAGAEESCGAEGAASPAPVRRAHNIRCNVM